MLRMIFMNRLNYNPYPKVTTISTNLSCIINYKFKILLRLGKCFMVYIFDRVVIVISTFFIYIKLLKLCKEAISLLGNIFLDRIYICMVQRNLVLYTKVNGCKYMRIRLYTMIIMTKIIRLLAVVIQTRYSIGLR